MIRKRIKAYLNRKNEQAALSEKEGDLTYPCVWEV